MPPNPERRAHLLDAAIDILADTGVGGLTHRLVDERAGLPSGTTSNYFRTRLALLEATTSYVAEQHWQRVELLKTMVGQVADPAGVKALMVRMLSDPDEQSRRGNIARFELFLEGTRRPEFD
jgi:DNA-binding transcriptional regulator YbjK